MKREKEEKGKKEERKIGLRDTWVREGSDKRQTK